jgi:hypothetical protein
MAAEKWASSLTLTSGSECREMLRDLYLGEYWKLALTGEDYADLLIASAGLGLMSPNTLAPGYAATFVAGSPDSIVRFDAKRNPDVVRSDWWASLASNGLGIKNWTRKTADVVLVALSNSYQQALAEDFRKIAQSGKQVIVMSGSRQVAALQNRENIHHVETGQWLRMVLGGSTPCVGMRFALRLLSEDKWHSIEEVKAELRSLERRYLQSGADKLPVFDRIPQSDAQVKSWILRLLKIWKTEGMKPSKSGFLREYRNAGFACEQKRFGLLYEEALSR